MGIYILSLIKTPGVGTAQKLIETLTLFSISYVNICLQMSAHDEFNNELLPINTKLHLRLAELKVALK